MRTDTKTFATRAFKAVRALGVSSVRSKGLARQIVNVANHGGYNRHGEGIAKRAAFADFRVEIWFAFSGFQYLQILDGEERVFTVSTRDGRIVSTDATPRQLELRDLMEVAGRAVYDASGDACKIWEAEHGYPQTNEAADLRCAFVEAHPLYLAAHTAYDALRDESLAENRHAPARTIDWKRHGHFSDWYKEETGCRPGTDWRYAEMVRWMERQSQDQDERLAA